MPPQFENNVPPADNPVISEIPHNYNRFIIFIMVLIILALLSDCFTNNRDFSSITIMGLKQTDLPDIRVSQYCGNDEVIRSFRAIL